MAPLNAKTGAAAPDGANERREQEEPDCPGSEAVRTQLERVLKSGEFIGSERTRRFLRFVVEETLAGRGDRIKAFTVAIAAFDRDESFDPQTDPIVRIEAGRLRRSLERYYLVAGSTDPVHIEIPKGTYVPRFSWIGASATETAQDALAEATPVPRADAPPPPASRRRPPSPEAIIAAILALILLVGLAVVLRFWGPRHDTAAVGQRPALPSPSVAVLPFGVSGTTGPVAHLLAGMADELVRALALYSRVSVLGPRSIQRFGRSPDVTIVGAEAGVEYVLSGQIQHSGQQIRVSVQLDDAETGGVVWAEAYEREFVVDRVFDLQVEIARDIVRRVAQPRGAIALFDWKRTRGKAPETWEAYDCVVQADELHRRAAPPAQEPAIRACLKRVVEQEPGYADAWTMLAFIEIDAVRFTPLAMEVEDSLELAHAAALRAVDLAPDSGRAHLALMMTLFFRGEVELALAAGEVALRLSPHDPDILGEVGLRHVDSGDVDFGTSLIREAMDLYQPVPPTHPVALSLAYLRKGLYQKASEALAESPRVSHFIYWCVVAAVQGRAGKLDEARQAASELLKIYPDFTRWAWREIERRNLAPELAAEIVAGWRSAGLEVPAQSASGTNP